ncbi:Hypothetical protein SRAE_1000258000 [Strongyloides ratti]|uniref:Uncharacterized protein n=1 Tax=Strongyloides ratti TaxID=34506 RepID=A0A090L9Z9_STRRB|nr:Hypothetical protein SRAE_1000258000 [Strongyloides ratti]CEF64325.1 Hypothetical protein SRAE_1000258000 [Strongyloides ratti]
MEFLWSLLLLYSFITLLFANCNVQKYYTLQGEETIYPSTSSKCGNASDNCATFISNIPEVFSGQYQDCSSNIFDFITKSLYSIRPDLKMKLEESKFIINAMNNCKNNSISTTSGFLFPGNYTIYLSCSADGTNPSIDGAPNIPPLSGTKQLQSCSLGNGNNILCKEGYCSFFEYSINDTSTASTITGKYYGCPNGLYNSMSDLLEPNSNSGVTSGDLKNLSNSCSTKKSQLLCGSNNKYQYFYFINCNVDGKEVVKDIPDLPPPIVSKGGKTCPYEVSGYFANKTSQNENKTINCSENYCAYVEAKFINLNGTYYGCPSEMNNVLNEINTETKGALNGTINDFLQKCEKKQYKMINIINVVTVYMDCYVGKKPDMSGNSSSATRITILSFTILITYFLSFF